MQTHTLTKLSLCEAAESEGTVFQSALVARGDLLLGQGLSGTYVALNMTDSLPLGNKFVSRLLFYDLFMAR